MRPIGPIGVGVLFLLLETVAPMQARQEQQANPGGQQAKSQQEQQHKQQQAKSQQEQQHKHKQQQAKSQQEQQHKQQQQQAKGQQEQQHKQQQAKGQQEQQHRQQQQAIRPSQQEQHRQRGQQQAVWQQHRAHSWQSEHRDWQQRGGYHGYRIPEDRYRSYFGPSHAFRIYRYPVVVVGGYPRFQYGGFWFSLMDPWPEYWSDDWYDNDDVYVDYYEDGYYLYNPRYPRDLIAITVYVR